ncbi:MAG: tyrosine recombinase XerC [Clostridiales bacterium]|nr:tyrosine recombinase XerC [Clostridiales bacterium]
MSYKKETCGPIKDFLIYHEVIKGHSQATIDEYFLDLRNFFRFIKIERGMVAPEVPENEIGIMDVDLPLIESVSMNDVYTYLLYLSRDRQKFTNSKNSDIGLSAATRARKIACLRSFFKYLTQSAKILDTNPIEGLESPKRLTSLPRYLNLEEAKRLLSSIEGINKERDYAIIVLFLNCGLRISEIVNLNIADIYDDRLYIKGKGGKTRVVFLNDSCVEALEGYLPLRQELVDDDEKALFVSRRKKRISREAVHAMVKKSLLRANLDADKYSSHKLRHTAATLMLQNGVDVRTLQELLGHEHLNTTQIYTHVENTELRLAAQANPLSSFSLDEE